LRKTRRDDGTWDEALAPDAGLPVLALSAFLKARGQVIAEGA
jgi:hypothetical protein